MKKAFLGLTAVLLCAACDSGSGGGGNSSQSFGCANARYSLDMTVGCPEAAARATSPSLNGSWLAATSDGSAYLRDSGGGGGNDHLYRYDANANFSDVSTLVTGMKYGGDVVAQGNTLYAIGTAFGGFFYDDTVISFADGTTSSTSVLNATTNSAYTTLSVVSPTVQIVGDFSTLGQALFGSSINTVANVAALKTYFDPVFQRLYLIPLDNPAIVAYVDISNPSLVNTLTTVSDTGTNILTGVSLGDITGDKDGNIYVACHLSSIFPPMTACQQGSVILISPDGSKSEHIVSGLNYVANVTYEPTNNQLFMLLSTGASATATYSLEVMNLAPSL